MGENEMKCANCKHWSKEVDILYKDEDYPRVCNNPEIKRDEGRFSGRLNRDCDEVAKDGIGINYPVADIETGPDFYCSRWEPDVESEPDK